MLDLVSEGMLWTVRCAAVMKRLHVFTSFNVNVPRSRMVDHLSSDPTTYYPLDPKNFVEV